VFQYWTNKAHPRRPGNIVTTHSASPPARPLRHIRGRRPGSNAQCAGLGNSKVASSN